MCKVRATADRGLAAADSLFRVVVLASLLLSSVEITEMPRDAPAPDTPTVEVKHHAAAATAPLDTGDFPSLGTGGGGASGAAAGGEGSAAWAQRHQEAQAASGSVEAALQEVPEGSATKSAAGGKAGTLQVGKTVPFGVRGMLDKKERLKVRLGCCG